MDVSIILFGLLGGGIAYMDTAYDEGVFSRRKAAALAPCLVAVWVFLVSENAYSATLLTAILAASLVTGKLDTRVFRGSAAVLAIVTLSRMDGIMWAPFVLLGALGMADEAANDYADRKKGSTAVTALFDHRPFLKMGVLGLSAASLLPWAAFLGIMAFDLAYDGVGAAGTRVSSYRMRHRGVLAEGAL